MQVLVRRTDETARTPAVPAADARGLQVAEAIRVPAAAGLYRRGGKRLVDAVVASMLLVALAPLCAVLTLLVACDGGRPVESTVRIGRSGCRFRCHRFRTTGRRSGEATRVGTLLRRTRLDALPQLVNVLRGDMSLVGPCPVGLEGLDRYGWDAPSYVAVRPGLISPSLGSRAGAERQGEGIAPDVAYAATLGLGRDLAIVVAGLRGLLKRTGT